MTEPGRPDAHPDAPRRDDLPPGVNPLGVPREGAGRDAFVMTLALVVALLGLIFTLSYVVYHRLA